ncbi:hypothetical protein [Halovivax cerinus]|uniref:Uncharacterized protein n=1 Tax=Halovivax cerinus TaxID=1487865 RepID=A0ABD5NM25_9EURY|nr:hypothetical protein [Halovivax cerinus]
MASNNALELGIRVFTAIFAILWLPMAMFDTNVLELLGGTEFAVVIATIVAIAGAYDLAELAGVADPYGGN